jgi:hypothetical protein
MEPPSSNLTDSSIQADPASEDPLTATYVQNNTFNTAGMRVPGALRRVRTITEPNF